MPSEARLALVSLAREALISDTPESASLMGHPSNLPCAQLGGEEEPRAQLFGLARLVTLSLDTNIGRNLNLGKDFYLELGN